MPITYIANVRLPTPRAHGIQILKMCAAFAGLGHRVELVTPAKRMTVEGDSDPFAYYGIRPSFNIRRVRSFDLLGLTARFGGVLYWLDLISFLARLYFLRIEKGSILYTRDPLLLLPFVGKKYFRCVELHNLPSVGILFYRALSRADKIIVLTRLLKEDLVARDIPEQKIFIAPDGFDPAEFSAVESGEDARTYIGLPDTAPLVVYTGHLYSWKGADTLAQAASLVPQATFVFVGGIDRELADFKERFGRIQNIRIVPFQHRSRITHYLRAADVLVLPNSAKEKVSARYTSPLKLFEYMASGRPIVASDLPSLREVLDESNAILVQPDEPKALAEGIRAVIEDAERGKRLASAAREKAAEFTWELRAKRILATVTKLEI